MTFKKATNKNPPPLPLIARRDYKRHQQHQKQHPSAYDRASSVLNIDGGDGGSDPIGVASTSRARLAARSSRSSRGSGSVGVGVGEGGDGVGGGRRGGGGSGGGSGGGGGGGGGGDGGGGGGGGGNARGTTEKPEGADAWGMYGFLKPLNPPKVRGRRVLG